MKTMLCIEIKDDGTLYVSKLTEMGKDLVCASEYKEPEGMWADGEYVLIEDVPAHIETIMKNG